MRKNLAWTIVLIFVLVGVSGIAVEVQKVEASETIHIRADGSIDPATANITSLDNVTYSFTDDIYDSIIVHRDNVVIDGAGYTLQGTGSGTGLIFWRNVTIKNMVIESFNYGIRLEHAENNTISGNTVRNCTNGVSFGEAWNNTISGNTITNNTYGIDGNTLMENIFSGNSIANNTRGIYFYYSYNNSLYENNITNNEYGVWLDYYSFNNTFYHNNFISNTNQVHVEPDYENIWDDGYPSGGNFWDDYSDVDEYGGQYQNETGSDWIWDHPYVIDPLNQDNYPLVPEFPTWTSMLLILSILTVAIAICKRSLLKAPTQ